MENIKITKRDFLNNIKTVFTTGESDFEPEVMIAFAEKELAQLTHKADKARERAAAKRAEVDDLYGRIMEVLSEKPKTVAEIVIDLEDAEVTAGKVSYRCSKMAANGEITKTTVKLPGEGKARTLVAYATNPVE